jgi:hypothetical protein
VRLYALGFKSPLTAHALVPWLIGLAGVVLATVSALPYAGGWNDGSRLATVESIVDRHTLAIDDSIFCRPQPKLLARGFPPYPPQNHDLLASGTRDKLWIGGHFYSDKPAVISFLMAGLYQTLKWVGLPPAANQPDLFCRAMTFGTAGVALLIALLSLHHLGRLIGLPIGTHIAWIASFGLSTFALTYTRHVNNHIILLAVVAVACVHFIHLDRELQTGRIPWLRLTGLGTLAGVGYNLDLGSGPLLLIGMLGLVIYRGQRQKGECGPRLTAPADTTTIASGGRLRPLLGAAIFLLAAGPWLAAGLGVNYALGGVWKPVNMVPEYCAWPGSPFTPANMTGLASRQPLKLPVYALALLFGNHGLVSHNLPLLLAIPALAILRRPSPNRPELVFALGWCSGTWLLYAGLSNNYGGAGCSIRWFVPFLAPTYYLLAVLLKERPEFRPDFLILSVWGSVLAAIMWWNGPWILNMVPFHWPIVGAALLSWLIYRFGYAKRRSLRVSVVPSSGHSAAA